MQPACGDPVFIACRGWRRRGSRDLIEELCGRPAGQPVGEAAVAHPGSVRIEFQRFHHIVPAQEADRSEVGARSLADVQRSGSHAVAIADGGWRRRRWRWRRRIELDQVRSRSPTGQVIAHPADSQPAPISTRFERLDDIISTEEANRRKARSGSLPDVQRAGSDTVAVPLRVRWNGVCRQRDVKTVGKCLRIAVEIIQVDLQTFHTIERTISRGCKLPEQPLVCPPWAWHQRLHDSVVGNPQRVTMEIF
jgi:hypothetical protein